MTAKDNEVIQSFRVDRDLRETFQQACQTQDITSSQVLRHFMREYVRREGRTVQILQKGGSL